MSRAAAELVSKILTAGPVPADVTYCPKSNFASPRPSLGRLDRSRRSDSSGTALAPSGDKRLDKDRTRTTTRRAETLLHKQASKRPMSPAKAGLLFFRAPSAARLQPHVAATVQSAQVIAGRSTMKLAICVAAALVALVAWAGGRSLARQRRSQRLFGQWLGAAPRPAQTYDTLSTVNGDVRVDTRRGCRTRRKTVNGEVRIESERARRVRPAPSMARCEVGEGAARSSAKHRP